MKAAIYLREASLAELLQEVSRRFEDRNPIPEWAANVIFSVTAYYGVFPEQLRSHSRNDTVVRARHLAVALLAQLAPSRSKSEVGALFERGHEIYDYAIRQVEEKSRAFPEYRQEIRDVLKIINDTTPRSGSTPSTGHAHCRSSRQGTCAPQG